MKRAFSVCTAATLMGVSLIVLATNAGCVDLNGSTIYWSETIIMTTEEYENGTIVVNGNLTLFSGGHLTLRDITLVMNVTFDGEYTIRVESGGELHLIDSTVTSGAIPVGYNFYYMTGSLGSITNTTVLACGHAGGSYGLEVTTPDLAVSKSFFESNYAGITYIGVEATITDSHFVSNTRNGITVSDLADVQVIGSNITGNGNNGIAVFNDASAVIAGNDIVGNDGEGVFFMNNATGSIKDNLIKGNQRRGIILWDDSNALIEGNTVEDSRWPGIVLWTSDTVGSNATVRNNTIRNNGYDVGWSYSGIYVNSDPYVPLIQNNTISQNAWDGIEVAGSQVSIVDNDIKSNDHDGIGLWDDSSAWIEGNLIESNLVTGIVLSYWATPTGSNATIVNNRILSNGFTVGWNYSGIFVNSDPYVPLIQNNTISQNAYDGIEVVGSQVSIVDNDISLNGQVGIALDSSTGASIEGNEISNNTWGIRLSQSTGIRIYHNNILYDTWQAFDDMGAQNLWDNGYPEGGNYWSDYTGIDQFSGPLQDQTGSDGIGDTAYVIDADSEDRYPLMVPFEIVRPRPPMFKQASLSGKDLENVTLTWSLSPDDGMGLESVVAYEIYRNMTYEPKGLGYELIATFPNGTSTFIDNYTGEGDPNNYFYQVCAIDLNNNTTCAYNQAGKFVRSLLIGQNLISIPLIQFNESIETVLQTVQYDKVWHYDSSTQEWKWHMTFKNYRRGLWNVNHTMGLWVNVTIDGNLTMAGIVPAQTTIHLYKGWNLVSFPSFNSSYTVYDLKMDTGAVRVEGYDPTPPYHLRVLGDAEVLLAGEAYWVKVEADVDWIVEVS